MKLYRFSPIQTSEAALEALQYVHEQSHRLCQMSFGRHLPVLGNCVIFTHYEEEHDFLAKERVRLCKPAVVENQKYYELKDPILFPASEDAPEGAYTHLYIRKPDPWRSHVGDLDFHISEEKYRKLKAAATKGEIPHARVFPEDRLDMIELFHPDVDVLAYIHPQPIDEVALITKSDTDAKTNW